MLTSLKQLLQGEWWQSMFGALLRTFLAGVVPLILAYLNDQPLVWYEALSQLGLLLVVTVLTSLTGIPIPGTAPWWGILASRFLRQFAQFLVAGIGTALLFSDVDWKTLVLGALASSISTVLIGSFSVMPTTPIVISGEVEPTVATNTTSPVMAVVPVTTDPMLPEDPQLS